MVIVDVQVKLTPLIRGQARILWNLRRLLDGAEATGVKVLATEQYPQGLGPTVPELASRLGEVPSKAAFSCAGCQPFVEALEASQVSKVLVAGIEAHVCVQQTVLDLLAKGYRVYVPVDAVGSRYEIDYQTGLKRWNRPARRSPRPSRPCSNGARLSGTPTFKKISALVREQPPGE